MVVDVDSLLAGHERVWVQRVEVLERWHEARARVEKASRGLERRRQAREAELVRVSQGLSARQRAWAARHCTYESRPRDRAGRQVLVNWTYRRKQIEAAETEWAATLATARQLLAEADVLLADASREVLDAWETQASRLTGVSWSALRLLAGRA
jgi:hypothetical protein